MTDPLTDPVLWKSLSEMPQYMAGAAVMGFAAWRVARLVVAERAAERKERKERESADRAMREAEREQDREERTDERGDRKTERKEEREDRKADREAHALERAAEREDQRQDRAATVAGFQAIIDAMARMEQGHVRRHGAMKLHMEKAHKDSRHHVVANLMNLQENLSGRDKEIAARKAMPVDSQNNPQG